LASDLTDADVAEDGPGAELGDHAAEHLGVRTAGISCSAPRSVAR